MFCAAALPRRLVLAHTHVAGQMRIHPTICPGETLPHPLLVPLPLSSLCFLLFLSGFYPSSSHKLFLYLLFFPRFPVIRFSLPTLGFSFISLSPSLPCFLPLPPSWLNQWEVRLCCDAEATRVQVLLYYRPSECSVGAIHRDWHQRWPLAGNLGNQLY